MTVEEKIEYELAIIANLVKTRHENIMKIIAEFLEH